MGMPSAAAAPVRVFISYKRHVAPDESVARQLFEGLRQEGHQVFIDYTMKIGQLWAEEIQSNVRDSDCLIVILTSASCHSEMVKGEVEIARDQAAKTSGRPRILPVRLAYTGPLPYPLNAWLDALQYSLWRGDADTPRVLQELISAIAGTPLPGMAETTLPASPATGSPLHSAPLPPPGGGLDIDDPWYIRRESDDTAGRLIAMQGVTLVIKGSRQMGKTSLLVRTLSTALDTGKRCALVDFQMLGRETLQSSSSFFRRLAGLAANQLELSQDIAQRWDAGLSDSQNFTHIFEQNILSAHEAPFVLAIDEADILFESEFLYDFFGMLRSWHNLRANPLKRKTWKKLDLVLVTSTEPYLFIDRDHESPFNVGEVVALSDFSIGQVSELNALHDAPLFPAEVNRLYELLHGQPYLTRKAFYVLRSGLTPEQLFSRAADDDGPFGDHLRNFFLRLLNRPELASALKQVSLGRGCPDARLAYRLQGGGLVRQESGRVVSRCALYAQYFGERL